MSEKMEAVATSEAPAALGAYSQAVKANGFVFVSGQLGIDPATGELAGETAGEQAAQALKNIKHILDTAGTGIEHVCRATIYLKNVEDFKEVDARYAEVFIGSVKPARVCFLCGWGFFFFSGGRGGRGGGWGVPPAPAAYCATHSRECCAGIVGRWSVPQ